MDVEDDEANPNPTGSVPQSQKVPDISMEHPAVDKVRVWVSSQDQETTVHVIFDYVALTFRLEPRDLITFYKFNKNPDLQG